MGKPSRKLTSYRRSKSKKASTGKVTAQALHTSVPLINLIPHWVDIFGELVVDEHQSPYHPVPGTKLGSKMKGHTQISYIKQNFIRLQHTDSAVKFDTLKYTFADPNFIFIRKGKDRPIRFPKEDIESKITVDGKLVSVGSAIPSPLTEEEKLDALLYWAYGAKQGDPSIWGLSGTADTGANLEYIGTVRELAGQTGYPWGDVAEFSDNYRFDEAWTWGLTAAETNPDGVGELQLFKSVGTYSKQTTNHYYIKLNEKNVGSNFKTWVQLTPPGGAGFSEEAANEMMSARTEKGYILAEIRFGGVGYIVTPFKHETFKKQKGLFYNEFVNGNIPGWTAWAEEYSKGLKRQADSTTVKDDPNHPNYDITTTTPMSFPSFFDHYEQSFTIGEDPKKRAYDLSVQWMRRNCVWTIGYGNNSYNQFNVKSRNTPHSERVNFNPYKFTGIIDRIEPKFPEGGVPEITIVFVEALYLLKNLAVTRYRKYKYFTELGAYKKSWKVAKPFEAYKYDVPPKAELNKNRIGDERNEYKDITTYVNEFSTKSAKAHLRYMQLFNESNIRVKPGSLDVVFINKNFLEILGEVIAMFNLQMAPPDPNSDIYAYYSIRSLRYIKGSADEKAAKERMSSWVNKVEEEESKVRRYNYDLEERNKKTDDFWEPPKNVADVYVYNNGAALDSDSVTSYYAWSVDSDDRDAWVERNPDAKATITDHVSKTWNEEGRKEVTKLNDIEEFWDLPRIPYVVWRGNQSAFDFLKKSILDPLNLNLVHAGYGHIKIKLKSGKWREIATGKVAIKHEVDPQAVVLAADYLEVINRIVDIKTYMTQVEEDRGILGRWWDGIVNAVQKGSIAGNVLHGSGYGILEAFQGNERDKLAAEDAWQRYLKDGIRAMEDQLETLLQQMEDSLINIQEMAVKKAARIIHYDPRTVKDYNATEIANSIDMAREVVSKDYEAMVDGSSESGRVRNLQDLHADVSSKLTDIENKTEVYKKYIKKKEATE